MDRFWIRPGRTQSIIFGCRHGCTFSDIMRCFERLGLIDGNKLSPEQIKIRRLETMVAHEAYVWANMVVSMYASEGGDEKGDLELFEKAVKILRKAERVGVKPPMGR